VSVKVEGMDDDFFSDSEEDKKQKREVNGQRWQMRINGDNITARAELHLMVSLLLLR
jgi:hypothetical protein